MKKKFLTLLIGTTMVATSLSSCGPIKFPNQPSDSSESQQTEQSSIPQSEDNNENVDKQDRVTVLVNNSLDKLEKMLYEPSFSTKFHLNYLLKQDGTVQTFKIIRDEYTNEITSRVSNGVRSFNEMDTMNINLEGNIDNLYYQSRQVGNHSQTNSSNLHGVQTRECDLWNGEQLRGAYQGLYLENGRAYACDEANTPYYNITDVDYVDDNVTAYLNMANAIANMDYDINISTISSYLYLMAALNGPGYAQNIQETKIIDLVIKTLDFINYKLTPNEYLAYICTNIINIDYKEIEPNTRTVIDTILAFVQNIDLDSILTTVDNGETVDVTFNYEAVKSIISSLLTTLEGAKSFLEESSAKLVNNIIVQVAEIQNRMPKQIVFNRKFFVKDESISKYQFEFKVDADELSSDYREDYDECQNFEYNTIDLKFELGADLSKDNIHVARPKLS